MRITHIMWDVDEFEQDGETITLPTELDIPEMDEDDIADFLSDTYGFCVEGFSI